MGDDLLAMMKSEREIQREIRDRPLVACPVCGDVLDKNNHGELSCPMGHYRAPAGATVGSHG